MFEGGRLSRSLLHSRCRRCHHLADGVEQVGGVQDTGAPCHCPGHATPASDRMGKKIGTAGRKGEEVQGGSARAAARRRVHRGPYRRSEAHQDPSAWDEVWRADLGTR
jgi:hypothetical protein